MIKTKKLKIISVSLGPSDRDHSADLELAGRSISVERIGAEGDIKKAVKLVSSLDGRADAFGLGGIDFYLSIKGDRYALPDAFKIAAAAKITPIVDGSGIKNTAENKITDILIKDLGFVPAATNVFICAMNRPSMAESFENAGFNMTFGDLMAALKLPLPVKSLFIGRIAAMIFAPVATKLLPYKFIYPVQPSNAPHKERFSGYFKRADIIAGDFNYINRHAPLDLKGKTIVTTSVTEKDTDNLRRRGVKNLITAYPKIAGRAYGANLIEAMLIALSGKKRTLYPGEYLEIINAINFKPCLEILN